MLANFLRLYFKIIKIIIHLEILKDMLGRIWLMTSGSPMIIFSCIGKLDTTRKLGEKEIVQFGQNHHESV